MANTAPYANMHRTQAVSDERMNPVIERAATDPSVRASRAGTYPSNPMPQAQNTYTSPSPPPPAPAPAPAVPVPGLPAHTGYHSLGNRNVPAQVAPLAAWPGVHGASMDTNAIYSLERIHAATLALCNFCNEHLDSQAVPRVEQLYAFTGTVQDINLELRSLIAIQEGRPARDFSEAAPYYPWVAGGAAQPYWVPGRDERDMKGIRTEGVHEDKQVSVHGRRRSSSQKAESMSARSLRHTSNVDELGYVPRADADLAGTSGIRADHMYLHQTPYVASGSRAVSETGPYVPKYRKRSRAPAPGICHACGNSDTPEWRRGPDGARTLCNACGLHFAKLVRRRTVEYSNSPPGTMIPPVTLDELRVSSNIGTACDTQHVQAKEESVSEPHSGDSVEQSARSGGLPMQTAASTDRLKDHVDGTDFDSDAVSRDVSTPTGRRSASEKGAAASQLSKHARQGM